MSTSLDKPYNFLQNNGFLFNLLRLPETTFRVVACTVPEISIPPSQAGYPGSTQYFPGSFTEFDAFTIKFLVDENLKNYEEMYHWATQMRFAIKDYAAKNDSEIGLVSDGFLTTLNNSSNPSRTFYFKDMFPVSVSGWQMDTSVSTPEPIHCTVSFRYSYFELR